MQKITAPERGSGFVYCTAAYRLANYYYSGEKGIPRDLGKALFYITKARDAGHDSTKELEGKIMKAIQDSVTKQ